MDLFFSLYLNVSVALTGSNVSGCFLVNKQRERERGTGLFSGGRCTSVHPALFAQFFIFHFCKKKKKNKFLSSEKGRQFPFLD